MISQAALVLLALSIAAALGALWAVFVVLAWDLEEGTQRFADKVFGVGAGMILAASILVGELTALLAMGMGEIAQVPAVLVGLLGLSWGTGYVDLTPGLFAIAALAVFLIARAVDSRTG